MQVQGLTISSIAIATFGMRLLEIHVMCSRVRARIDLFLLERFRGEIYKDKRLSQDLLDECDRLSGIARETLRRIGEEASVVNAESAAIAGPAGSESVANAPVSNTADGVISTNDNGSRSDIDYGAVRGHDTERTEAANADIEHCTDKSGSSCFKDGGRKNETQINDDDVAIGAGTGAATVNGGVLRRCTISTWDADELQRKLGCYFGAGSERHQKAHAAAANSIVQLASESLRQRDLASGGHAVLTCCDERAGREFHERALDAVGPYGMANVVGDGSCLFGALTVLFFGSEDAIDASGVEIRLRMRQWIASFFRDHPVFMGYYLDDDVYARAHISLLRRGIDPDGCRRDASIHFSTAIRTPPEYGNDACILAASLLFNADIRVICASPASPLTPTGHLRWAVGGFSASAINNVPANAIRIRQASEAQRRILVTLACFHPTHFDAILPL